MDISVDRHVQRFENLESRRSTLNNHCDLIRRLVWPDGGDFVSPFARELGERKSQEIYDGTAAQALEKFAAALESLMTPRTGVWHRLRASDDRLNKVPEVKAWFEQANTLLFAERERPRAGYYGAKHENYKSIGAFGTACLYIETAPDPNHNDPGRPPQPVIRYQAIPLSDVYFMCDGYGLPDKVYRRMRLSAHAAYGRFGERAGPSVMKCLEKNPEELITFLHCVYPRSAEERSRFGGALGMKFGSVLIAQEDRHEVMRSGYEELPYIISRYTLNPNEEYGRSPAMLVLPDILTLQSMERTHLRVGHKMADPPLLATDESVIGAGGTQISLRPAAINYNGIDANGRPRVMPLLSNGRLDISIEMMERKRYNVNDAFLVTLFQVLVQNPGMTATEALIRLQEKGQLLAPAVGRQQDESLGPQIERELGILARLKRLPPLPRALLEAAGEYRIEYESPATRAQKAEQAVGLARSLEVLAPIHAADPGSLAMIDSEEATRLVFDVHGVPSKVLLSPEAYAAKRAAQDEAAQASELAEVAPPAAKAVKDLAQAGIIPGGGGAGPRMAPRIAA